MSLRDKQGTSLKGPKISRKPDRLLKRMIRGMLPWNKSRGRDAFKRLRCYVSEDSEEIINKNEKNIKHMSKNKPLKYMTIKQISELL